MKKFMIGMALLGSMVATQVFAGEPVSISSGIAGTTND